MLFIVLLRRTHFRVAERMTININGDGATRGSFKVYVCTGCCTTALGR